MIMFFLFPFPKLVDAGVGAGAFFLGALGPGGFYAGVGEEGCGDEEGGHLVLS